MPSLVSRIGVTLLPCALALGCLRGEPTRPVDPAPPASTAPDAPRQPKPPTQKSSDPAKAATELREATAAFEKFRAQRITASAQGELVERGGRSYRKDL